MKNKSHNLDLKTRVMSFLHDISVYKLYIFMHSNLYNF